MGPLAWLCCLAVVVSSTVARPSAEVSGRDARGQTISDSSDPLEKPRSMDLSEAYKGGVIPVGLVYDRPEEEDIMRPLRDTITQEGKKSDENEENNTKKGQEQVIQSKSIDNDQDSRDKIKNSKLLDLEARVNDEHENAKYGLDIQSRNKVPAGEETQELEKPFVYNIQPLSFYSTESKEEENILNYINKIKEMKENQIKFASKKEEKKPSVQNTESTVVTEYDDSEEEGPIRRKIQRYETVIKPMDMSSQAYRGVPQGLYPVYPASTYGLFQPPYQQYFPPTPYQNSQQQTAVYLPNIFRAQHNNKASTKFGNAKIFDDYFPILINNPFNEIWTAMTNIVEYGSAADVCKKSKKGRGADDAAPTETEIDLSTERVGLTGTKSERWPNFARLKVRRGGVAIAGPGGIATAGSGGTAIVGPGGTAYTTREGTAIVGPGGRVVRVPEFPIYAKNVDGSEHREFVPPSGSQFVAEGPTIYYDNPLDNSEINDPAFPV